jgi:hypothetical protein
MLEIPLPIRTHSQPASIKSGSHESTHSPSVLPDIISAEGALA